MLNIYTLHYFYVTAQHLNFSKAAKHLYITQPALSKQIQQLEDQLQVKLFDRTKRSVKLTDAGQVLTEHCRNLFQTIADLEDAMEQFRKEVRGNLRVASTPSLGNYVLPDFLKRFSNAFPQIMLHTVFKSADEIVHMLRTNELDFGLLATADAFDGLESKSIEGQNLVFICSAMCDHECTCTNHNTIVPSELENCRFINFEKGSLTRKAVDELAKEYQVHLNNVAETENVETIKSMVIRGMGGAIVPMCTIDSEVEAKMVTVKQIEGVSMKRPVSLYYSKDLRLSKAHREFLQLFEAFKPGHPEKPAKKTGGRRKSGGRKATSESASR